MRAVQCTHCGGAVAARPGQEVPTCLFCGSDALVAADPMMEIEAPELYLPFTVDPAGAEGVFRTFAAESWFYPPALRDADLALKRLYLPAWQFDGEVETHWAGLERAMFTKSGKRPRTGAAAQRFEGVMVPASRTLSLSELTALGHWQEDAGQRWDEAASDGPWEVSEVSRQAARALARDEMGRRHAAQLEEANGLITIRTSSVALDLGGRPLLLPVWIGVYTWKDTPRRVLVHGQRGHAVGERPLDPFRVAMAVLAVLVALAVVVGGIVLVASG